jgi:PIN domain nuclease of toxin-antitoxin system
VKLVFDAFAIIAALGGEPAAPEVAACLRQSSGDSLISSVNVAEIVDSLVRTAGQPAQAVEGTLGLLRLGGLRVAAVDEGVGMAAGRLRAKHYDRQAAPLSLADCVALATAQAHQASLVTADPALARAARAEGVELVALPDSQGRRP